MLTSLASVKTQLGITDASEDALLNQLIPQADQLIKTWCHQNLEQQTLTEYYDGRGNDRLRLHQRPVTSVASVAIDSNGWYGSPDGSFDTTTTLIAGQDYVLVPDQPDGSSKAGLLQRILGVWPSARQYVRGLLYQGMMPSRGIIKITYTAGYAVLPNDLVWACNQVVCGLRLMRIGQRFSGEGYEGYNYTVLTPKQAGDVLEAVKPTLGAYRIYRFGI